jgi:serine/threonine-protein kinase
MGRVYLALDSRHDRHVAIKVLDPDYARAVGTQRFVREIHIAGQLSHPQIVPLYDSGEVEGQLFYVMPHIEGESLRQYLVREGMLPVPQVLEWAAEISEGLSFAHEHGIIHRDIKPENLLIQSGHVLIADFGIARALDLAAGESITSEQLVLGTPTYMSPEQASGAKLDKRSDIYSLACVVYEMLAGEPPYQGSNPQAITAKKLSGHYQPVRVIRPGLPEALDRALERGLAVNPADRYASAKEFRDGLRASAKPKGHRLFLWLVGLVAIGTAVALATREPGQDEPAVSRRPRVVVGIFENRTGRPRHDALGFMAADWITEGLQRTGSVDVVPTATALGAVHFLRRTSIDVEPIGGLATETGADVVVAGSLYQDEDTLTIQAQVVDVKASRLIGAVEPIRIAERQRMDALQQVRARVMGLLALSLDDRVVEGDRPPIYTAYLRFGEGMDAYVRNQYAEALTAFQEAYASDTTFALPLLYASFCYTNGGDHAAADSVLAVVARQRERLSAYDRDLLDYQRAELAGNDSESLRAIRRAAESAPTSKAAYNFAVRALEARQPFAAESALRTLSPDVGPMRGWFPYWDVLASSLHAQGKHQEERRIAAEARRRFPDRQLGVVLEARALAAEGKSSNLDRLWSDLTAEAAGTATDNGTVAYEVGVELRAHGDSMASPRWLSRAYQAFSAGGEPADSLEARWKRARTAAQLGRLQEALDLASALAAADPHQLDYVGLLGEVLARLGSTTHAQQIQQQLSSDRRAYAYGRPQFLAARIAATLGDLDRAVQLLESAKQRGYPYDLEFHRDQALIPLRGLPILRQLDAQRE